MIYIYDIYLFCDLQPSSQIKGYEFDEVASLSEK